MVDYEKEIKEAIKNVKSGNLNKALDNLPDGLTIGKKAKINDTEVTYVYTEKQREILKYLHGQNIEENIESSIKYELENDGDEEIY